jgi:hypothetical protein
MPSAAARMRAHRARAAQGRATLHLEAQLEPLAGSLERPTADRRPKPVGGIDEVFRSICNDRAGSHSHIFSLHR